ncbi:MAG TPA: hypothetical protein V6C58_15415, partial [Allocoleopsis sp.]
ILARKIDAENFINVAEIAPFLHDENEKYGLVFQHFAYILESQLRFKELYYGYKDAVKLWKNLQQNQSYPQLLRNYFAWVEDNTLIGKASGRGIIPLLQRDRDHNWYFISPVEYQKQKEEDLRIRNSLEYLQLREINLIMFPDWSQSEDDLYTELAEVISAIATSPNAKKATLLIDISNSNPENVELILSSIAMNLMMENEIDISETLQISLMDNLSSIQWKKLLPMVNGRIILNSENKEAIALAKAENLPDFQVEN